MAHASTDGRRKPRASQASRSPARERKRSEEPAPAAAWEVAPPRAAADRCGCEAMRGSQWIVDDFLCVGNFASAGVTGGCASREEKRKQLLRHGITHIVNCAREFECPFQEDFEYLHVLATDNTNQLMIQFWPAACEFIDEARADGGRVLVHCAGGHSRSGSTAVAYLMRSGNTTLHEALAAAREKRYSISPNPGFLEQLEVWHRLGFAASSKGQFRTPATFPVGVMRRFRRRTGGAPAGAPASGGEAAPGEAPAAADGQAPERLA
mmetsp:Transcript_107430/g.321279  ORF Transcript_107430/g.321279 Transcript_107430/m.321279 type:complete len:266 (-) Transcript_107430:45-842(-)